MVKISIHVDGYYGLIEGVPRLLNLFEKMDIKTTFFVNMGKESSIFEILRYLLKNKREFKKTKRVVKRYSKIQMLSTILLNRKLGHGHKKILREIEKKGHEVEPHCWNHLEWSKNFNRFDYGKQIKNIKRSFWECLGRFPKSFVPPTWKLNKKIITELEKQGFREICVLSEDAKLFKNFKEIKPDVLTFNKTIEELLQEGKSETEILEIYKKEFRKKRAHIYFHADYEGRQGIKIFERILKISFHKNYKGGQGISIL